MTIITVDQVSHAYPSEVSNSPIRALDKVSVKVQEGDSLAIVGPSGCGKTTLLRIIAGLERPQQGSVYYDGQPIESVPRENRGIGMVFQNYALVPHWQASRSIGFFLRLRHREDEVPERVHRVARITGFGIDALLDKFPSQLSGGEKQRISIARAFARDLRLLLFDEPFANLDAKFRSSARVELRKLMNEFPVTSVLVTHDQHEAASLARRIVLMREGQIIQTGSYETLYQSPINLFVAQFIGTPVMNLFPGVVRDGQWYGENFGGYPLRRDLEDGSKVTLGIRPEYVSIEAGGTPAVIEQILPHFAERYTLLHVWLDKEHWQIQVPLDMQVHMGETIYCTLKPEHAMYFDTKSGQRIG